MVGYEFIVNPARMENGLTVSALLTLSRFDYALKALQHALILAPQNPFYVQQAAETAYTAGDVPLATKFFLGVVDMTEDPDLDPASRIESVPEGLAVRAWFGLKQVSKRLAVF